MHLTLCSFGSRGDVQPYLALGLGLRDAGHEVRIATSRFHERLVRRHGLDYFPLTAANPRDILRSEGGMRWLETGRNPIANLRAMRNLAPGLLDEQVRAVLQFCADSDAVIYSVTTMLVVAPIAELLGVPAAGAWLQPLSSYPRLSLLPLCGLAATFAVSRSLQPAQLRAATAFGMAVGA